MRGGSGGGRCKQLNTKAGDKTHFLNLIQMRIFIENFSQGELAAYIIMHLTYRFWRSRLTGQVMQIVEN